MGVQIDEPGKKYLSGGVDDVRGLFECSGVRQSWTDIGDLSVSDQNVHRVALAVEPHPPQQHAHATTTFPPSPSVGDSVPTSRWNSTAIRTCTPLETCCSTADWVESATDDEISMPRSMGPGCSTTA